MKKRNYINFVLVFVMFILMPLTVNAAEEFTTYELIIDEPVAGGELIKEAKIKFSNNETFAEYDVNLEWICDEVELTDADTFESDMLCMFDFTDDDYTYIEADFVLNQYTLAEEYDVIINENLIVEDYSDDFTELHIFYIDGLKEVRLDITGIEVGNTPLDTVITYVLVVGDNEHKIVFSPGAWSEVIEDEYVSLDDNDIFETGKVYAFDGFNDENVIEGDVSLMDTVIFKIDVRTKFIFNGENVGLDFDIPTFGPLVKKVNYVEDFDNVVSTSVLEKIPVEKDFITTLVANDGYKLPEKIKVLIGNAELTEEQYTYDYTTGNLVIFGSNITDVLTISVLAEKIIVENPDTNDAVIIAIFLTILSFITIVVLKVHFKKLV